MRQLTPATPQPEDSGELASELLLFGHGTKPQKTTYMRGKKYTDTETS